MILRGEKLGQHIITTPYPSFCFFILYLYVANIVFWIHIEAVNNLYKQENIIRDLNKR